jgi:anti-sigma-K factor RskA
MRHQQLTDELQEKALLYAAGALDETERDEYSRHLEEDDCAVCKAEVRESEAAAQSLSMMLPMETPSESVKRELLARAAPRVERPRSAFAWGGWVAAAAALVLAAVLLNWNSGLREEVQTLNARVDELESQVSEQQVRIATLTSLSTRPVNLAGLGSTPQARGRIYWDQNGMRWLVNVEDLPAVPNDRTYELWFVPAVGNPVRAEIFNTDTNGDAMFELPVPPGIGMLKAAAVTIERAGGTDQPTTSAFNLLGTME